MADPLNYKGPLPKVKVHSWVTRGQTGRQAKVQTGYLTMLSQPKRADCFCVFPGFGFGLGITVLQTGSADYCRPRMEPARLQLHLPGCVI